LITTFVDAAEIHPDELVTVYVYVPAASPVMVQLVPVPLVATPPGVLVSVQVPVDGKLLKTTLPVDSAHVGCIMPPATGAEGEPGAALITILPDAGEIHPDVFVTVKV